MEIPKVDLQMNYTCDACGKSFNVLASAPAEEIVCPYCRKPFSTAEDRRKAALVGNLLDQKWLEQHKEK